MISQQQVNVIKDVIGPYNPNTISVFGSYARNENTNSSDLDLLVDLQTDINLLDLIGIEQELTERLGVKVDLVTLRSIKPDLEKYILRDLVKIM
jgi:predicted nucleotidyltransferase